MRILKGMARICSSFCTTQTNLPGSTDCGTTHERKSMGSGNCLSSCLQVIETSACESSDAAQGCEVSRSCWSCRCCSVYEMSESWASDSKREGAMEAQIGAWMDVEEMRDPAVSPDCSCTRETLRHVSQTARASHDTHILHVSRRSLLCSRCSVGKVRHCNNVKGRHMGTDDGLEVALNFTWAAMTRSSLDVKRCQSCDPQTVVVPSPANPSQQRLHSSAYGEHHRLGKGKILRVRPPY